MDDKLKAIDIGNESYATLDDATIAQIKQVFTDAGYVKLTTQRTIDGKEVWMATEKIGMTGQEFYERFRAEIDADSPIVDTLPPPLREVFDAALEAARRAAGVEDA